jgi:hypothetical protein
VVSENFNDKTANNWTLQDSLRPTTHQVRNLRTKKSQLKKAANFKFFKAYNKSLANEIISRINEFVDRFQEAKEDVDCKKALAKLLTNYIGKSTKKNLAALQDFMKRASVF